MTDKQDLQYDDSRNRFYKAADQDNANNNPAAAANDLEQAIGANPKLVLAHYQLGHIYGDKLNDPISSIFHYQQYLKLAPSGDKTDEVKAQIDKESQAYVASLPNVPAMSADDVAKLQADNAALTKQVEDAGQTIAKLQAQLGKHHKLPATASSAPATTPAVPPAIPVAPAATPVTGDVAPPAPTTGDTNAMATATPPRALPLDATNAPAAEAGTAADTGSSRSYKVVAGDSLWKIAHKMYPGDTSNGEDKIKEANKDVFNGKYLKPGQVLVIPQ